MVARNQDQETDKQVYIFRPQDINLEKRNVEEMQQLMKRNPTYLLEYYRKKGEKDHAISLLFSLRKPGKTTRVSEEIVNTYIYFDDYEGALDYIKHYERVNEAIIPIESLIRVNSLYKMEGDDDEVFQTVKNGLFIVYNETLMRALVWHYKKKHGVEFQELLKPKLEDLDESLFGDEYVEALGYFEARYLYHIMPKKNKFIRQMVKRSPYIKKKYFLAYSKIFGIKKDDISRILSVHCPKWAFKIAFRRGWIDRKMRVSVEKRLAKAPVFINKNGKWCREPGETSQILFLLDINDHKKSNKE
ncbi:hypothetical protein PAEPH01_1149 [Pancytospora epiphaga]|nr:hypothetical protein PAEPH01_1149 [Pancytospora epiphaga]